MDERTLAEIKVIFDNAGKENMDALGNAADEIVALLFSLNGMVEQKLKICDVIILVQQYQRIGQFDPATVQPSDELTQGDVLAVWIAATMLASR
ncbi:MAG: hypothetical protein ACXADF_14960 [Candidatus Thorarchaeota archaeon]|jgi:hypothetical protein